MSSKSKVSTENKSFGSINLQSFGPTLGDIPIEITIPDGVSRIIVQAWGPGGGGASATSTEAKVGDSGGGGGGGGGYLTASVPVSEGQNYILQIGRGGKGGQSPAINIVGNPGIAGSPTVFKGPGQFWVAYSGGGGLPATDGGSIAIGGEGGGAAFHIGGEGGTASPGQPGSYAIGLSGIPNGGDATSGGNGGIGGISTGRLPTAGTIPGGGGGGGGSNGSVELFQSGADGADGRIIITYLSDKPLVCCKSSSKLKGHSK